MSTSLRILRHAVAASATATLLLACGDSSTGSPEKLVASAKDYIAKGDNAAAIIQLKNALVAAPDHAEARFLLGKASFDARDFASAEKELRRALELNYAPDTTLPLLARSMIELGQHDALIRDFGGRKLEDPLAQATVRTLVADAYLRSNDRAGAEKAYADALVAKSDYAPALLGRAVLTALGGKLDEALAQVDAVIAASPKLGSAHAARSDLLLAKGDRAGAKAALQTAIDNDPELVNARLAMVGMLIDDREFDAATVLLEGTRKIAPRDLRIGYLEASIAFRKGDREKARELVQQVLKLIPEHPPSLMLAGTIELQAQRYAAAEIYLAKALSRAPGNIGARQLLVQTYLRIGQPARARDTLQPLLDRGMPSDPRLQLLAGETFLATGDVQAATTYYQAAAKGGSEQQVAARTRLGQIALARGKSEEGFRELEAAADLDGDAYQADLALIAGHLRRNEFDKALAAVKGLEKKQPKNPLTYQMYGVVNLARKDTAAARRNFEQALELQPNYVPAAYNLAGLDLAAGKPEDAVKRYEAMIAKDDKNDQLYLALAELHGRTGADAKVVVETVRNAVKANPQSVRARLALIEINLRANDTKAALTAAEEALAAMPTEPRVLDAAGVALEAAGENNRAIETFTKLASLQPQAPQPQLRLALLYARQKETSKAVDAIKRAQKLMPNSRDLLPQLVQVYLAGDRHDEALNEVRALQKSEPKWAGGYTLEGDIHMSQKKFAEAEKSYRQALALEPNADGAAIRLHRALVAGGKAADADALAKKWVVDHPKNVAMRLYLGERDLAAKNLKAASQQYQAVIAIDPNNALALNNLAWVGGELGDPKALGHAERAAKLAPSNAAILDTYGMLLVKHGESAKGLEVLTRATKLAPKRHDLRLNYAKALGIAGQKDAARKELESLLATAEDFPGKSEIPAMLKSL